MKIIYLGQAGFLFETKGMKIMVDPYLSNSVEKVEPHNRRRVPVEKRWLEVKPDVLIFTHNHLDHYDPETADKIITPTSGITVLAPASVYYEVRKRGGNNLYILFDRHTQWSQGDIRFSAVKAVHSDPAAIGVIIDAEGKKYYITGDTLYNEDIFSDIPEDIYALFLPVNGVGNNMNMQDAARFAQRICAERTVPIHVGMFDSLHGEDFVCNGKVIPEIYKEIEL